MVGWFRRFRLPPPSLVCVRFRRPPFFLCPFRVCSLWLVFDLSLFSCVPLFASWLSKFHRIFIVISHSLSFHLPRCCGACVCVRVYHLYRCKTSLCCRGVWHSCPTTRNEAVDMSGKGNVAGFLYPALYIYLQIDSPTPWCI